MELKSMKMAPKEMEPAQVLVGPKEIYPYGLSIRLEKEQLAALGFEELPDAGQLVALMAKGKVVKVESREDYKCVEIQITDLAVHSTDEESEEPQENLAEPKMVEGAKYSEKFYGYME